MEDAPQQGRLGFTLIELLVVIAVLSILMGILLPSLGRARDTALDLKCKSNCRQCGMAIEMYTQDQNPATYPYLYPRNPRASDRWHMVELLGPYTGYNKEIFICPSAVGAASVLDPATKAELESGLRFHSFDENMDGELTLKDDYITEYWFNDSKVQFREDSKWKWNGVSGQQVKRVRNPQLVVLLADAIDWIPRHGGGRTDSTKKFDSLSSKYGWVNMVLGDQSLRSPSPLQYYDADQYGAPGPFYNWGHYYPDQ